MRKLLLLLTCMLSISCYAQHFQFQGIPIDSTTEYMEGRIVEKGWVVSVTKTPHGHKLFSGQFVGYRAYVVIGSYKNLVYSVVVTGAKPDGKFEAKSAALNIISLFEKKYETTAVEEEPDRNYNVFWRTINTNEGYVAVGVTETKEGCVWSVNYVDTKNYEKIKSLIMDDL